MTDLLQMTIKDLLAQFRAKTLSPSEYWAAVEARIEDFEPHISALYAYDPESARAQAKASTER
ncbi:MAG: amidase, partial [Rhizobium sp.]|nr:amidase [Rhizobium sp.]